MIILGLDASTTCTGWAIIDSDNLNLIAFGELHLNKFKSKKEPIKFLLVAYDFISEIIKKYKPQQVWIEDVYYKNVNTIKALSRLRGAIELACLHSNLNVLGTLKSSHIRKSVLGKGNLEKPEICTIFESRYNIPIATPGYDASDAILVALGGAQEHTNILCQSKKTTPQTTKSLKKRS